MAAVASANWCCSYFVLVQVVLVLVVPVLVVLVLVLLVLVPVSTLFVPC